MASAQPTETQNINTTDDSDDFAATDLCDFGFVLAPPKPAPETHPENFSAPQ